jgi:hypothetical protein
VDGEELVFRHLGDDVAIDAGRIDDNLRINRAAIGFDDEDLDGL